ncbi:uncharacterized protein LOC125890240 isoform X1 [Epinephelus fuscoguttatus]|uniref:uncharacterized protein LOC125890240 isoform X1 n=1 Tax=Epinephelus fuscoguttatus TaxID=293821 RepID=UPI0020D1F220|nr:uncharacterized protein LOC125890240 isoform X1 [Epinephelus fuscoguttatus]
MENRGGGNEAQPKPDYIHIAAAARNLLSPLAANVEQAGQVAEVPGQVQGQGQGQAPQSSQERRTIQENVQQEMSKSFPALFRKSTGKRRFSATKPAAASSPRGTKINFYLLPNLLTTRTPQGTEELTLLMAGLGKRVIMVPDNSNHSEEDNNDNEDEEDNGAGAGVGAAVEKDQDDAAFVSCSQSNATEMPCPICQVMYPAQVIEMHASGCNDMGLDLDPTEGPCGASSQTVPSQNQAARPSELDHTIEDWKTIPDQAKAAQVYRKTALEIHASGKPLYLRIDIRSSQLDQEMALIAFYKACSAEWVNPLQCRLEGDPAIGEGVNRFVLSRIMEKLKYGFKINLGNAGATNLFDGEPDHLVPSSSAFIVDSDLCLMAGRMIGHCFLNGGPALTGLSPAIVHVLCGGTPETALIKINDCPDLDLREKITLLEGSSELSAEEKESLDTLCLAWDLPLMTQNNRRWLFERLLHHAVIGRTMKQVKQIRKGLKETMVWPLICARPDVAPEIFPREMSSVLTPECILECIKWPKMTGTEDNDNDECSVSDKSCITGYLRQFIENASSDELKALVKFWVGWEAPTATLIVEVVDSSLPKSSTCFETLRLPARYKDYMTFKKDLIACLQTSDTGFGLV